MVNRWSGSIRASLTIVAAVIYVFCCVGTDSVRAAEDDAVAVTVDARTILSVNGYRHLQSQLFGLTAYEGSPMVGKTPARADALKKWGIESLGMPGVFGWVLPRDVESMDANALDTWFADPKGAPWMFNAYPGSDRYVYGKLLPNIRAAGTEPWMYLLGGVPGHKTKHNVPTDNELLAKLAVHYVSLVREADPEFTYVHLFNEPNASWFRDGKGEGAYTEAFTAVATALKAEFPKLKIGGPVLCWPPTWPPNQKGTKPWYTWRSYSKPLIDTAIDDLDFLDWHAYGVPARMLEGELHIVTGYATTFHNKWLSSAITETNFGLNKEQWMDRREHFRRRVIPMIRQTFTFLRNPDKVFCQQVHDLYARAGAYYRFMGSADMEQVTPMQEFYEVCKPLRGTRLVTSVDASMPENEDIWIEATYRDHRLTVAMANLSDQPHPVRLTLKGIEPGAIEKTIVQVLDAESLRDEEPYDESRPYALPAQTLKVLVFQMKKIIKPTQTLERHEYFAKTIMAPLKSSPPSVTVTFALDAGVQTNAEDAALRFGIKGKGPAEGRWQVVVAGQTLTVDSPGAFIEVPLPMVPQGVPIEATFTRIDKPDEDEQPAFLSFASLVLDQTQ